MRIPSHHPQQQEDSVTRISQLYSTPSRLMLWTIAVPSLAQESPAEENWIQAAIANLDAAFGSIVSAMSWCSLRRPGDRKFPSSSGCSS